MNNSLEQVIKDITKAVNELDIKLSFINTKLNKLNNHITYIYLLLLLNLLLNTVFIFK